MTPKQLIIAIINNIWFEPGLDRGVEYVHVAYTGEYDTTVLRMISTWYWYLKN